MNAGLSLFLDVQGTQDDVHPERGIPRYITMLVRALLARPGAVSRVALNPAVPAPARLPEDISTSPNLVWNTPAAFREASAEGLFAYHIMSPFHLHLPLEAALPAHAFAADAFVVTLYDLIPLHDPAAYLPDFYSQLYRSRLSVVRSADLVLTLSNHTSVDAVERLGLRPSRVVTVGAGVSPFFTRVGDARARAALCAGVPRLSRPFVLTVSGHDARKNTALLLRAFARLPSSLRRELQLVVVGYIAPDLHDEYLRVTQEEGCADDEILWAGRVSDDTLRALYQSAEVFVFPSVLEGFGLPVLEAAACGCPALTARSSSLPEILDWVPSTFDPSDPAELTALLQRATTDSSFRSELARAGDAAAARHTWEAVADRTLEAVGKLRARRAAPAQTGPERGSNADPTAQTRLRLAFVGAMAGRAGHNRHNARVADALRQYCDLEVFATDRTDHAPPVGGVPTMPVEAFDRLKTLHGYDAILYAIGSRADPKVSELAHRAPGLVWLHDAPTAIDPDRDLIANARAVVASSEGGDVDQIAGELVAVARGLPADARVAP